LFLAKNLYFTIQNARYAEYLANALITNQHFSEKFMTTLYKGSVATCFALLLTVTVLFAQTSISGKVVDSASGESLAGVNIVVKGKVIGTITDTHGAFSLQVNDSPPLTIMLSFVGYKTQEVQITNASTSGLDIKLEEQTVLGQEVVISASRVEESILKSPVTVEKVDLLTIQQTPAPEFYDALANVKGVQVSSGSLNFPQINTRGFATIANVRFVQLMDGMDNAAPLLNFPTANIVGIGELDIESMELLPGAASALYGPNAFNGLLIMRSKSPFEFQGLSAQFKGGLTNSEAWGKAFPMYQFGVRYAKSFNNKFAFKVNFSMLQATDWLGNDYRTDRLRPEYPGDLSTQPNFDGMNLYGDETDIPTGVPSIGTIRRTGFREEDILKDDFDAKSLKGDIALHYRINDRMEAIYNYRYGGGSSIYQGTEKYALRDFTQQFHKLELKADNFFVRGYLNQTDAGDSYNLSALGGYMNEEYSPSATQWARDYVLAMQGYFVAQGVPPANHQAARNFADRDRPAPGTPAFKNLVNTVKERYFQRTPPGASFIDDSRVYHAEFNYNFADKIKFAEIQLGGNYRMYDLFSNGTIFNEAPDDGAGFERIKINEFGFYGQIAKTFAGALKLTASLRYDKNENFEGQTTPRISAVYTFNDSHNIRASFQTGFRNPDTQAQFIFFPSSGGTLLGSTEANAARYGVHNGGAYTEESFLNYRASGGTLNADGTLSGGDQSLLVTANIPYVQPEQLVAYEIGYKGILATKMLIDLNGYYTSYNDFIGGQKIYSKQPTTHQGNPIPAGTIWDPYVNSQENVDSYGVGVGITYTLPRNFTVNANYNYANLQLNESEEFRAGFNTPENKFQVGFGNRKLTKNFGFNLNYRWQDKFLWESSYGNWNVPAFGVFDAMVSYKVSTIKTIIKLGGTNLFGGDYRTNIGAPFVGQQYYLSLTFDEFFN
jgi:iron complex outermembrane recepter protein